MSQPNAVANFNNAMRQAHGLELPDVVLGIRRASGVLQAPTSAATAPATVRFFHNNLVPLDTDTLSVTSAAGGILTLTFSSVGSGGSGGCVDTSGGNIDVIAELVVAAINAASITGVTSPSYSWYSGYLDVQDANTGSAEFFIFSSYPTGWSVAGGGTGTDAGGATLEFVLQSGVGLPFPRGIRMIKAWADGAIGGMVTVALFLRTGMGDAQISATLGANNAADFSVLPGTTGYWLNGVGAGESLVAKLVGGTLPIDSSTCTVAAIFELY
jgi:hypothetical protein